MAAVSKRSSAPCAREVRLVQGGVIRSEASSSGSAHEALLPRTLHMHAWPQPGLCVSLHHAHEQRNEYLRRSRACRIFGLANTSM